MDEFIDQDSITAEQKFLFMLHERIEKLEIDNEKLKTAIFIKPINIAEIAKSLYAELKKHRLTFDKCVKAQNETNRGYVPESVYALLPEKAKYNAREYALLTQNSVKFDHIFTYAIAILEICGEQIAPEVVTWVSELAELNVIKLSK